MKPAARYTEIAQALRKQAACPPPLDRGIFWDRFKARTEFVPQQTGPAEKVGRSPWGFAAVAAAAAAAVIVAVAVIRGPAAASHPQLSKVSELDVYMDYSSVLIVEDRENRGTVIWLASAEETDGG